MSLLPKTILGLAVASSMFALNLPAIGFANAVLSYDSGVGFATDFETGLGYTLTETALGLPNRDTLFGPVHPFNPPFERSELLSLGEGGHVLLQLSTPILNDAANPYGIDFVVYGNTGFIDVNYPEGQTDEFAGMFGLNTGETTISVSLDNVTFYTLNPVFAPTVDGLFPTDGSGTFGLPVDPSLTELDFANKSFADIQSLYNGSAGGTGYNLDWAIDGNGQSVLLESAQYVRIDVLSGRAEIDAIAVVPEPSTWAIFALGFLLLGRQATRRRARAEQQNA